MFCGSGQKSINLLFSISLAVFLLTSLCAGVFAADDAVPQQVRDWQMAADELEKSGDFAGAQTEYEKVIQAYPKTAYAFNACTKKARLYVKQKKFENIGPMVAQICTDFPEQPNTFPAFFDLVEDCMYAKAYSTAESICVQVQTRLSSDPRVVKAIGWRGMVYAWQGNLKDAEQMRQSLLETKDCISSDFLDGMRDIGWGYYCSGNWDEALVTYGLGLDRDPTHPQAVYLQYQIVRTCLTQDDIAAADREMETLLAKYGHRANTPGLAFRLANEYYKKWNLQGAINVCEKLLSQFGDHELVPAIRGMEIRAYKTIAKGYRREKQTDKAIATYETVFERFGDDEQVPSIRDAIVETYADAGDLAKAQEALQTDIEKCPHRPELLRMITRVAVETARAGDTDTAMELVEAIFDQNPEGADQQLFGYTTRARVYVHQGKDTEAAATVDKALELFKDHPDYLAYHLFGVGEEYYLRADKALQNNEKETATENFLKAITLWEKNINQIQGFGNCRTYYYVGNSYWRVKDYENAARYFSQLYQEYPNDRNVKRALELAGECYCTLYDQKKLSLKEAEEKIENNVKAILSRYPEIAVTKSAGILGAIKCKTGQWDEAVTYLEMFLKEASSKSQQSSDTYYMLGQAYEKTNQNEKAILNYQKFINSADSSKDDTRWVEAMVKVGSLR